MTTRKAIILALSLLLSPIAAVAAEQTVTLKVDGMTCASCPYQVRSALKRVDGVKSAEVTLEPAQAVVTFDDALTNVVALTTATANAGYPSLRVDRGRGDANSMSDQSLLKAGIIAALCCFTPVLVVLVGAVGLSAVTGYLDYVLFPALAFFIALTVYAVWRRQAGFNAL